MKPLTILTAALLVISLCALPSAARQSSDVVSDDGLARICSQTKMKVLKELHGGQLPSGARTMSRRGAEVIPESQCPLIGGGGNATEYRITCYHAGNLVWCCSGGLCCDSAYGGYGCWHGS